MTNSERKALILNALRSKNYRSAFEAINEFQWEISSLEAIPFGLRNEPIRIAEDIADGVITCEESLTRLIDFLEAVPD